MGDCRNQAFTRFEPQSGILSEIAILRQLIEGYLVGFGSLTPVTNSQITKAHQITRTTSRTMAFPVVGFTNKPKGVRTSKIIPTTTFGLALFSLALSLTLPSAEPTMSAMGILRQQHLKLSHCCLPAARYTASFLRSSVAFFGWRYAANVQAIAT
jgi:hypothetical protein